MVTGLVDVCRTGTICICAFLPGGDGTPVALATFESYTVNNTK